jgi:hypothetical protein
MRTEIQNFASYTDPHIQCYADLRQRRETACRYSRGVLAASTLARALAATAVSYLLSDQAMLLKSWVKLAKSIRFSALENPFQAQKNGCKDFGVP